MTRILVLVVLVAVQYALWRLVYKPGAPQGGRPQYHKGYTAVPPTTLQFYNLVTEIVTLWNKLF